jgi:hypothetical protein
LNHLTLSAVYAQLRQASCPTIFGHRKPLTR